jgi:hypothetical protein
VGNATDVTRGGALVVAVGGDVVPVGGCAVVLAIELVVEAIDERTVGAIWRCGGKGAPVVGAAWVVRGPPRPTEPVVTP